VRQRCAGSPFCGDLPQFAEEFFLTVETAVMRVADKGLVREFVGMNDEMVNPDFFSKGQGSRKSFSGIVPEKAVTARNLMPESFIAFMRKELSTPPE